jgi:hypothetical protein
VGSREALTGVAEVAATRAQAETAGLTAEEVEGAEPERTDVERGEGVSASSLFHRQVVLSANLCDESWRRVPLRPAAAAAEVGQTVGDQPCH